MYRTINKHPSGAFNTENIFLSPRNPIQQKKRHSATSTAAGKLSKSPYSFATLPHDSCANNIYIYCITSVLPLQEKESRIELKKDDTFVSSFFQSARRDSNPRPRPWQGRAPPTEPLALIMYLASFSLTQVISYQSILPLSTFLYLFF